MPACPQCQTAVETGQRFCPNCGARQPETTQAQPDEVQPGATVILPPPPTAAPTARLDPPPAPSFGLPPAQTPTAEAPPAAAPHSYTLPPGTPPTPQPVQGKTRWGLILGIIGGVLALGCIVVAAAGFFLFRSVSSVAEEIGAITPPVADVTPLATIQIEPAVVLFEDDFESASDSVFNQTSDESSSFSVEDGVYVQTVHEPNYFVWSFARESFDDAVVEVDATLDGPEGGAAAILFRYQDENNFYIWRVYGDGTYSLQRYVDDELAELIAPTEASAINGSGETNRLRVETVGNRIRLFVNDELIGSTSDSSFSDGDLALGVSAEDSPEVTVRYDNLAVSEAP
jgi:hypothetical protein